MIEHALRSYPHECCGFMLGIDEKGVRTVVTVLACRNEADHPTRTFLISPAEYLEAENKAVQEGLELIGIYHSHPDCEALPSRTDTDAALPFFSYLICSAAQHEVWDMRSWTLSDSMIFEEETIIQQQIFN